MEVNQSELIKSILKIIDEEASSTVGVLCRTVEVLEGENSLNPSLYKNLAKETVYERFRILKKIITANLMPKVTFTTPRE